MEKIKKVNVNGQEYELAGSGAGELVEITYAELKALKDTSSLVPEQKYRIIDYVSLFKKILISSNYDLPSFKSANHAFDLIVTANTNNTFYHVASAALHEGDEYFSKSDLSKWVIYYSFDNDSTKYPVDDTCKGFIYRMIDEYNNDVSFDFKNLLSAVFSGTVHNLSDSYSSTVVNETYYKYFYLFSCISSTSISDLGLATDASVLGLCKDNKIDFTSFTSISVNGVGCILATIKSLLNLSSPIIVGNIIKDSNVILFSKGLTSYGNISYNTIIDSTFRTRNIAGDISYNTLNSGVNLEAGVQNWEQSNYSHVMSNISYNFAYPGTYLLLYGSNKNSVKFSNNIINAQSKSRLLANASITNCILDGEYNSSGNDVSEDQDQKRIVGNGTDIKIIDKYTGV